MPLRAPSFGFGRGTPAGENTGAGGLINDVAGNVWTPTKSGGYILPGSWANLPLNEWCRVAGSTPQQLQNDLATAGFPMSSDYGTGGLLATMNSWVGCALAGSSVYIPRGGGHADSSENGIWRIDLERMGAGTTWAIEAMPSNPDAVGFAWSTAYRTSGSFTLYPPYTPYDDADVLPDGKPTSSHTYGGVWYDSLRNTISTSRHSRWAWDLTSKTWTRSKWSYNAAVLNTSISAQLIYYAPSDEVVGHFSHADTDYFSWDRSVGNNNILLGVGGPPNFDAKDANAITLVGATVLALWTNVGERWGLYDIAARTWSGGAVGSPKTYGYNSEMMVCCHVPDWGRVIRRDTYGAGRGTWWQFNLATKANEVYVPAGLPPPFAPYPGNKCFYYAPRKCVVYIAPNALGSDAVYVMRTG